MTGKLSKNFHGVGIGPLSNILAVKKVNNLRANEWERKEKKEPKIPHLNLRKLFPDLVPFCEDWSKSEKPSEIDLHG